MSAPKGRSIHAAHPTPIRAFYRDDIYRIQVEGRLGQSACFELRHVLAQAEASRATRIVLDIDRLVSLDARGLHAILRASRRSAVGGDRLRVTRGKGHIADIFRLTALDQTLPFADEDLGSSRQYP